MTDLLDHVAERSRAALATLRDGTYRFVDYVEDDMVSDVPIRIEVAMTVRGGHVHLDYTGTDPQVSAALNVPSDGGPHPFMCQTLFCYIMTLDRDIPKSGSLIRPIAMTLPKGTVVNPGVPGRLRGPLRHRAPPLRCGARLPRAGRARASAGGLGGRHLARGVLADEPGHGPAARHRRRADDRRRGGGPVDGRRPRL